MPEDLDFEKLFKALDEVPGLVEAAKKLEQKDQTNSRRIEAISDDVSSMKNEMSSLKSSIIEAKNAFSKPVNIQDRNIHVTKDDIRITQQVPGWVQEMGKEYSELKHQTLSRKERNVITIGGPKFSTILSIIFAVLLAIGAALYLLLEHQRENSAEAYAERAYNAAVANDYRNPGDYYANIRELYNNGEIEDAKNSVEHWEQAAKNRDYFKNVLSPLYDNQKIIIDAYSLKNGEAVVWWRLYDDDKDMVSHIQKDGKIIVADADKLKIESIEDAHKYSRSKHWRIIREATQTESME